LKRHKKRPSKRGQPKRKPPRAPRMPELERAEVIAPEHFNPGSLGIAVFGPGKGEAIVVRLPDGRLGVVDGCREPKTPSPRGHGDPVRELLAAFAEYDGCRVEEQRLAFVCLTHPHDDHYAGLGRLMEAYGDRIERLWMPPDSVRYMKDLFTYLDKVRDKTTPLPDEKAFKGLARVIDLQNRMLHGDSDLKFEVAVGGLSVIRETGKQRCRGHALEVSFCSPGGRDAHLASRNLLESIRFELEAPSTPHYRAPDPNAVSASLLIRWGHARILLAGDLLCQKNDFRGWTDAAPLVPGNIQVVNVAHHASDKAHHPELWERMKPIIAIVTPFKFASDNLPPRPEMLKLLSDSGAKTVVTTPPDWPSSDLEQFEWDPPLTAAECNKNVPTRNAAISPSRTDGHDDRCNAVAVSLKADGSLARLVLGGRARVLKPI